MQQTPFVSVIIPVLNDANRLRRCLEALKRQTYHRKQFEVIVIDNGPSQEVQETVKQFPNVRLIVEPNRGTSRARNAGMLVARGKIFAFTDSDCVPGADWLECGVSHLCNNPKCGMVGGRIRMVPADAGSPRSIELYDCALYLDQYKHVMQQHFAATANAFIPKAVLQKVGSLHTDIFPSEDEELGQRIHMAGFAITYAPDACVEHPATRTFAAIWYRTMRNMRGKVQYYRTQGATSLVRFVWQSRHFVRLHIAHDFRRLRDATSFRMPLQAMGLFGLWMLLHMGCILRGIQLYCIRGLINPAHLQRSSSRRG